MSKTQTTLRLDRLLSNLGYASRKEVAAACKAGMITLDDIEITKADTAVPLERVRAGALKLSGQSVDPPTPLTIMLNKPLGFTCSHKESGLLVYDLLPTRWRARKPAISSIGRLDKESSGQLLLTDDGGLLHRVIHPKTHPPKHYHVTLRDPLKGDEAALFGAGDFMLSGEDKPLKPALWTTESANSGVMILTEGRYHQIRRMFEARGNLVTALHRFQTGNLPLGDLPEGEWRILSDTELSSIFTN